MRHLSLVMSIAFALGALRLAVDGFFGHALGFAVLAIACLMLWATIGAMKSDPVPASIFNAFSGPSPLARGIARDEEPTEADADWTPATGAEGTLYASADFREARR